MKPTTIFLLALLALGAGCSAPGDDDDSAGSDAVASDGGSWLLTLSAAERVVGWNDLELVVRAAEGEALPEGIEADVRMPAMGHGSTEPVEVEDVGEGAFVVRAFLQMAGDWELNGTVITDGEAWTLPFEVVGD